MLVAGEINKQMNGKLKQRRYGAGTYGGYIYREDRTPPPPKPDTLYCWAGLWWPAKCDNEDRNNGFQKGDCTLALYTGKSGNLKNRLGSKDKGYERDEKTVLLASPVDEDEDENKQEQLNINVLREAKNLNPSFVHCLNIKDEHKAHQINTELQETINNLIIEVKKLSNITRRISEVCFEIEERVKTSKAYLADPNYHLTKERLLHDPGRRLKVEERDGALWVKVSMEIFPEWGSLLHRKLIRLYKEFEEINLPMRDPLNESFVGWKACAKRCMSNSNESFPNFKQVHLFAASYWIAKRRRGKEKYQIKELIKQNGRDELYGEPLDDDHPFVKENSLFTEHLKAWNEKRDRLVKRKEEKLKGELKSIFENDYFNYERSVETLKKTGWDAMWADPPHSVYKRWIRWHDFRWIDFR